MNSATRRATIRTMVGPAVALPGSALSEGGRYKF